MPAPATNQRRSLRVLGAIAALCTLVAGRGAALDVPGVLPNSIGLPEVNVVLRPTAGAAPYSGVDFLGDPLTNLRMIYDTGASGVILFEGPALALPIPVAQFMGTDVVFADVGVGGSTTFGVSDPIHMSMGNFVQDPPDPYTSDGDHPRQNPGLRLQLGPPGSAVPFLADFTPLGVVGVPAMLGRVSLINPKLAEVPLEELTPANTIHTYVYDPAVPAESGPGILTPELRVAAHPEVLRSLHPDDTAGGHRTDARREPVHRPGSAGGPRGDESATDLAAGNHGAAGRQRGDRHVPARHG